MDAYWQVFLFFGAVIQIIDDWTDLEKDLTAGHYSYVTLGIPVKRLATAKPRKIAGTLRSDPERVQSTYRCSHDMIVLARAILAQLDDPFLLRLVDVTNLRLETYFRKKLKLAA